MIAAQVNASSADVLQSLRSCARVQDDHERLACYDHAAAPLAVKTTPTAASAPVALTQEQRFGLSSDRIGELESSPGQLTQRASELRARVISVSLRGDGLSVFTLDNDQIWAQTEKQTNFTARPGDAVVVSRGALGSFWLALNVHLATRVKRLR